MNLLITLEAARKNIGYTLKDAAPLFNVCADTLSSYEKDSSNVGIDFADKVSSVYKMPKDNIFFGRKSEFIRTLRKEAR